MVLIRWLLRELRHQRSFAIFFTVNFMAGLAATVCLNIVKTSLTESLNANAKTLLGADVAVSSRRKLTETEQTAIFQIAGPANSTSRLWEFFAMIESGGRSHLARIEAVDSKYPLIGTLAMNPPSTPVPMAEASAWASPELLSEFDVKVGETVKIDNLSVTLAAALVEDPKHASDFSSFAPRLYLSLPWLQKTGWLGSQATLNDIFLIRLADPSRTNDFRHELESALTDPGVRVQTAQGAARDSIRAFTYLADYLGLVSLAGFLLAAIGCAFLVQQFLQSRRYEMAILNAFGLEKRFALIAYFSQIICLAGLAGVAAVILGVTAGPIIIRIVQSYSPVDVVFHASALDILGAIGLTLLGAMGITLPLIFRLKASDTKRLLDRDSTLDSEYHWRFKERAWFVPGIGCFFFLCVFIAHSWKVGAIFFGAIAASALALLVLNRAVLSRMAWMKIQTASFKIAFWQIARKPALSITLLSTLTFAILLIDLIPQVENSIQKGLALEAANLMPSLFLFDIQDEQKTPLGDFLERKKIQLNNLSPMIRGRILKTNGKPFERGFETSTSTREDENDVRFRNRGINLSYRADLRDGEEILEGPMLHATRSDPNQPAELSVEKGYAKRLGLHLHDRLLFDVQGVEIEGEVVNFRKVHWTSFQPNFFIVMQPGVLDEAPKTWIASLPAMDSSLAAKIQTEIVHEFPNISMVDVQRVVTKIVELTKQISQALLLLAAFVFGCGLIVLISIGRQQMLERMRDFGLLKMLGADDGLITRIGLAETLIVCGLALFEALSLSAIIGWAIMHFVFEDNYIWSPIWAAIVGCGSLVIISLILFIFARELRTKSATELRRRFE